MDSRSGEGIQREFGIQPLDEWMNQYSFSNRDLVLKSTEQLTHKQVQKARKGRRISANLQNKIRNALQQALRDSGEEKNFSMGDLFNYKA